MSEATVGHFVNFVTCTNPVELWIAMEPCDDALTLDVASGVRLFSFPNVTNVYFAGCDSNKHGFCNRFRRVIIFSAASSAAIAEISSRKYRYR